MPDQSETVAIWRTFRESSLAVKAVLAGIFVNRIGGFLNLFLVLFLSSLGYSDEQGTLALGVYGAGSVLGLLIGGALADRLGARNATVLGTTGSAGLIAALLYLPDYWMLLVAAGLAGLIGQVYRPASAKLLSDLTPDDRQIMIFAMYRFCLNLGTTAAPLIGYALYKLNGEGYTLVFWGEAVVALVYAGIALAALPPRASAAVGAETADAEPAATYREVLADRRYLVYLVATFLNAVVYVQYLSTLPLDVKNSGLALFWYTLAVSLNGIIVIAFELPLTKFSQTLPFRLTIGLAFLLVGVGYALYGLPLVPAVVILGTLVWTTGEIVGAPTAFAYPAIAGPSRLKGRYIGSFQFAFGAGSTVGPVVGGLLYARMGHSFWPLIAVVALVSIPLALAGVRPGAGRAELEGAEPAAGSAEVAGVSEPEPHAVTDGVAAELAALRTPAADAADPAAADRQA